MWVLERRQIRFMAWRGEESGKKGARGVVNGRE